MSAYAGLVLTCTLLFYSLSLVTSTNLTLGSNSGAVISKRAFVTFLAADTEHESDSSANADHYFVAVRILAYSLLYAPETRMQSDIPLVALVTEGVSEEKIRIL